MKLKERGTVRRPAHCISTHESTKAVVGNSFLKPRLNEKSPVIMELRIESNLGKVVKYVT